MDFRFILSGKTEEKQFDQIAMENITFHYDGEDEKGEEWKIMFLRIDYACNLNNISKCAIHFGQLSLCQQEHSTVDNDDGEGDNDFVCVCV